MMPFNHAVTAFPMTPNGEPKFDTTEVKGSTREPRLSGLTESGIAL